MTRQIRPLVAALCAAIALFSTVLVLPRFLPASLFRSLKVAGCLFGLLMTSALAEARAHALYTVLRALVHAQGGAMVSIAHRPSVAAFHDQVWTFVPQVTGPAKFVLQRG